MEANEALAEKKYLTRKNKVSFAFAGFGQNLIIGYVNAYILFFYTDILIIGEAAAAAIMIAARIWDALNDPMMGTIVDRTHTRFGKMRPYLLFVSAPLALATCLLFLTPNFSLGGRIAYASVTYILWGMVYTVCDVPFWGLASVMTPNPKERLSFISNSRLLHAIGGALPMAVLPIFSAVFNGGSKAYTFAGLFVAIVGGALFILSFTGSNERCVSKEKSPTLRECFKFLKINKPMQKLVLANLLGFMRSLPIVAGMYIATYVIVSVKLPIVNVAIEGSLLNTVMVASWGVSGFIGMLLTPKICKLLDYRKIYFISAALGATVSLLLFFIGPNFYAVVLCLLFLGIPYGLVTNINYAVIAESVDYVEWKTGKRAEGVTVSFQTLMNKMMAALQSGTSAIALIVIGFIRPEIINGESVRQAQTQSTLNGMFLLVTVLPAIGWVLSAVPMIFFKFVGREREKIYAELFAIRAEKKDAEPESLGA